MACATIALAACCRTWALERAAVSLAKSASRIRLREAERFSLVVSRLEIVAWKRFCTAPRSARPPLTWLSAASITLRAWLAPSNVEMSIEATLAKVLAFASSLGKTEESAPVVVIAPLMLTSSIVPVLTADTVPFSVSVVPPKFTESSPAVALAKFSRVMLRPSVVVSVMSFFA